VTAEDIYRVMPLCLRHRLRKDPLEQIDSGEKVQDTFKVLFSVWQNPVNEVWVPWKTTLQV